MNIKSLRRNLSLTQEEFGQKIGVNRSLIAQWETGRNNPGLENLRKIKEIFNITLDQLTGRTSSDLISIPYLNI